jgi:hypothetical protein
MQYKVLFCVLLYSMMHSDVNKKILQSLFFPFPLLTTHLICKLFLYYRG